MKSIIVTGDVSVDWLVAPVPPTTSGPDKAAPTPNWQLVPGFHYVAKEGGALLVARFLKSVVDGETQVIHPQLPQPAENVPTATAVHSVVELKPVRQDKDEVFRASRLGGFCGPIGGATPAPLRLPSDDAGAQVVVLDDAGNGFRADPSCWPAVLTAQNGPKPIVIFKTHRPLWPAAASPLAELLFAEHLDNMLVLITADDLRAEGLKISRRLSWERTVCDFCAKIAARHNALTRKLSTCRHLIVRLGVDAALYYRFDPAKKTSSTRLIFDPQVLEGGFCEEHEGWMIGYGSAFTATLAEHVSRSGLCDLSEAIQLGIQSSRQLLIQGFGRELHALDYPPLNAVWQEARKRRPIASVDVPAADKLTPNWSILHGQRSKSLDEIAYEIVREGSSSQLNDVPVGRFHDFETIDRSEIESFQAIRNLIREYLAQAKAKTPLSIAVFGPPGAGKSYGVERVTKSATARRIEIEKLDFNVAQFTSVNDLRDALHKVRDAGLNGRFPLVFFDEFDASLEGKPLGWLKFFLAPMQDGKFKDGETMHPLGRALFVFAGGTSSTYAEFARELPAGQEEQSLTAFRSAKGPDFVSRLRGYVNILGPNPTSDGDDFAMLRRAKLLRSLLERKTPHLLKGGKAAIDDEVLRALIKVSNYKHGVRSIEAVLDMSMLREGGGFEQASLPPEPQLALHVDCRSFSLLLERDVIFGATRERLARAIHEQYRRDQAGRKDPSDQSIQPWETLREDLRESNREVADDIPKKLRLVNCNYAIADCQTDTVDRFACHETEKLAMHEHKRWCTERERRGWRAANESEGEKRDDSRRVHDSLKPWDELSEDTKEYDREQIRALPPIMKSAGFVIVRQK